MYHSYIYTYVGVLDYRIKTSFLENASYSIKYLEKLNIFPFLSREENYMKDFIKKLIDVVPGSPT